MSDFICETCKSTEEYKAGGCMPCRRKAQNAYYAKNKKRAARTSKARYTAKRSEIRQKQRAYSLWRYFRITVQEYDKIKAFQQRDEDFKHLLSATKINDAVEHRHSDGKIRGVMAPMLNRAYGIIERLYGDRTGVVLKALTRFHEEHPAVGALGEERYGIIGLAKAKRIMKYGGPDGPDGRRLPDVRPDRAEV